MDSSPGKHLLDRQQPKKFKKRKTKPIIAGSAEDVLASEVAYIIRAHGTPEHQEQVVVAPNSSETSIAQFDEVVVNIMELASAGRVRSSFRGCMAKVLGDGLGLSEDRQRVVVVPFTVPGRHPPISGLTGCRRQSFGSRLQHLQVTPLFGAD
jgi:hypothetical protein